MRTDKTLANFELLWSLKGGDTGRGRVEHRSFIKEIGQARPDYIHRSLLSIRIPSGQVWHTIFCQSCRSGFCFFSREEDYRNL